MVIGKHGDWQYQCEASPPTPAKLQLAQHKTRHESNSRKTRRTGLFLIVAPKNGTACLSAVCRACTDVLIVFLPSWIDLFSSPARLYEWLRPAQVQIAAELSEHLRAPTGGNHAEGGGQNGTQQKMNCEPLWGLTQLYKACHFATPCKPPLSDQIGRNKRTVIFPAKAVCSHYNKRYSNNSQNIFSAWWSIASPPTPPPPLNCVAPHFALSLSPRKPKFMSLWGIMDSMPVHIINTQEIRGNSTLTTPYVSYYISSELKQQHITTDKLYS